MKKIVFDLDNTISQSTKAICDIYTEKYGDEVDYTKVRRWDFMDVLIKSNPDEINSWFSTEDFFDKLKPIDGMIEFIHDLNRRMDVELYICTCHRPKSIALKDEWIRKHFNFDINVYYVALTPKEIIKKDLISCDIFIDDSLSALDTVNAEYKICFGNYGYNKTNKHLKVDNAASLRNVVSNILDKEKRGDSFVTSSISRYDS